MLTTHMTMQLDPPLFTKHLDLVALPIVRKGQRRQQGQSREGVREDGLNGVSKVPVRYSTRNRLRLRLR